ncbi:RNA Methylase, family [Olea europaea subsp. europaea]|uniref:RNA Methylase, family n=1 Tax=Olea europaea subsp. europaea TaxID=158383 RepID=A0A8S0U188_OLEEU|nr:RNA Methylase, family [Olea europaea subsp. europaea]
MSSCKTLIRTSLLCLEFKVRSPNTTIRHFSASLSPHPGLRLKTHKPPSISRHYNGVEGAISLENSEEMVPQNVTPEVLGNSSKETIEVLLSKDKDDIARLMKFERRPGNDSGYINDHKPNRWFPYLDEVKAGDMCLNSAEVLEALDPYIMETRKDRFLNVVNNRSYSVCLVVEGLSDFGNVSAAFRSADALGLQSVHVVSRDGSKRYKDNRHVSMGAEKWLDIELWNSTKECFEILKSRGYRIATTHLGMDAVSLYDVDWSCPTAIVVGNEHRGISNEALDLSDLHCSIPMRGMVDSFNVSVAAGLLMHHAVYDRNLRMGCHGDLTLEERQILLAEFYLRHNTNSISIANEYAKRKTASSLEIISPPLQEK